MRQNGGGRTDMSKSEDQRRWNGYGSRLITPMFIPKGETLEGKETGHIVGPTTFREIAYMLLHQTLVYLTFGNKQL
jgi:hypothetical protein